jgi:LysR family cys regulon transcriptional activator
MNITQQQLDCFVAVVDSHFHISRAAQVLFLSQPGVSRHLQALEEQVGQELFVKEGRVIRSLSPAGEELLDHARKLQEDWDRLKHRLNRLGQHTQGNLRIATTHTQAVYRLPEPLRQFRLQYPEVQVELHQGAPHECVQMVLEGKADLAIATEEIGNREDLLVLPVYRWNRGFLVPADHPLTHVPQPGLAEVAAYPVLTYSFGMTGRSAMDSGFAAAGVQPRMALTAVDSEVIKVYVRAGFGVGIVASMIWNPERDQDLFMIDASHCFPWSTVWLGLPKDRPNSEVLTEFVRIFGANLPEESLQKFLRGEVQNWEDKIALLPRMGTSTQRPPSYGLNSN